MMKNMWLYGITCGLTVLIFLLPDFGINAVGKEKKSTTPQTQTHKSGKTDPASSPELGAGQPTQSGTPSITIRPDPKIDPGSGRWGSDPAGGPPMEGQRSAGDGIDQGALRGRPGGRDRAPRPAAPSVEEEGEEEEPPPPPPPDTNVSESVDQFQQKLSPGKLDSRKRQGMPSAGGQGSKPYTGVGLGSKVSPLPVGPDIVRPKPGDGGYDDVKEKPAPIGGSIAPEAPPPPRPQEAEADGAGGTAATEVPAAGRFTPGPEPPPRPEQ